MEINGVGSNNYNYGNYTQNNVNKTQNEVEDKPMTSDEFLKELKQEFPEMKIYTANITDSNRNKFAGGTGIYNVAVSEEYMNEVAGDPEKREKFKQTVREMKEAVDAYDKRTTARNSELVQFGFVLDDEGKMNSWGGTRTVVEKNGSNTTVGQLSLFSSLINSSGDKIKLDEEFRETRRLEEKELEKIEQKKLDEMRLVELRLEEKREEKLEEKRREEKRELDRIHNENIVNSNANKIVTDTYKKDSNFNNSSSNFNTEA